MFLASHTAGRTDEDDEDEEEGKMFQRDIIPDTPNNDENTGSIWKMVVGGGGPARLRFASTYKVG